jgi:proline iminopeptidase
METNPKMKANLNGVELYFDIEGSGLVVDGPALLELPTIVLLHGGPASDHTTLKPWFTPLSKVAQLVYLDHRGTGRSSEADPSTYRREQLADDLEALRQYLGLGQIGVLGHSYGGIIALTYALRHARALSQLLLVGTPASHRFWERSQEILCARGSDEQIALGPTLLNGEVTTEDQYLRWWRTMLPLYFVAPDADTMDQIVTRARGNVRTAQEMLRHDLPTYDVELQLGDIAVPTFIANGSYDWISPPEQSQLLAQRIPGAELFVYERSGHCPFIEEAGRFSADVADFVRRHANSVGASSDASL